MTAAPLADGTPNPAAGWTPRKFQRTRWFLSGAALLLVALGAVWLLPKPIDQTKAVQDATDAFFRAVVSGGDAYGQLCASARSAMTRAQFEQNQSVQPLHLFGLVSTDAEQDSATVTVVLTYANGNIERHQVPLARENGTWKVCGRPY